MKSQPYLFPLAGLFFHVFFSLHTFYFPSVHLAAVNCLFLSSLTPSLCLSVCLILALISLFFSLLFRLSLLHNVFLYLSICLSLWVLLRSEHTDLFGLSGAQKTFNNWEPLLNRFRAILCVQIIIRRLWAQTFLLSSFMQSSRICNFVWIYST